MSKSKVYYILVGGTSSLFLESIKIGRKGTTANRELKEFAMKFVGMEEKKRATMICNFLNKVFGNKYKVVGENQQ